MFEPERPLIAVTLGDPAGVGPETIVSAWSDERIHAGCRPVVLGHPDVVRRAVELQGRPCEIRLLDEPDQAQPSPLVIPCLPCGPEEAAMVAPACISAAGGQAAYEAIRQAVQLARDGKVDGITTAPLHKAALHAAGHDYPGHTELLADLAGVEQVAMMLHVPPGERIAGAAGLNIVHVTLHVALRAALDLITTTQIVAKARLVHTVTRALMADWGIDRPPRLSVCALNPHAGEEGLFGTEERDIIGPAVEQCRQLGWEITGPCPADTLLARAVGGEFDAVVAMYHDQGHIAVKLLAMHDAVNVTLGLPFQRTSVAHGTAFDRAWQGRAESKGMVQALRTCAQLIRQRRLLEWS